MSINTKMVSELRNKTNATMDVCKRALVRTNGDMSAAEEEIRINYKSLVGNSEIDQLRQRVQELEERRCEVCGYAEHHREHTGCLRVKVKELTAERDELLKAAEAIEINAEECLDFDECTAMLVQIDDYHKLMEAIASVKEK